MSASSFPTTVTGNPRANSRAVTARSSSPTKLTPSAPVRAAAPPNGNSIPTFSSSAKPLAANALSLTAMRVTLEHILTPAAFEHMIPLAKRFTDGVAEHIRSNGLPWNVIRLGARAEYTFAAKPPRNGGESAAAADFELECFLHLYALNRGVLLTPFHNMALMSPATTEADIDAHSNLFASATRELTS